MAADLRDKIRKLLALAESPNEHEAKSALLRARALMAEHKLTEAECMDAARQKVEEINTGITCSKRMNPWIATLSAVIGEHYCCKSVCRRAIGYQTSQILIIGLEEDAAACNEIFNYAVNSVIAIQKQIQKAYKRCSAATRTQMVNSYGLGLAAGLSKLYEEQQTANAQEWGLILAVPPEVQEAVEGLGESDMGNRAAANIDEDHFRDGYAAGKAFAPDTILRDPDRDRNPRITEGGNHGRN